MRDLIIIGASGFGKEVHWLAKRCNRNILGFLDDTEEKQGINILDSKILGKIEDWVKYRSTEFIIAIGSPNGRKIVKDKMLLSGKPKFTTLIDPSAIIGNSVTIGDGSILCAGVICTVNIEIKDHVIINLNSTIGHDVIINNYCTISPNASISGNIEIKELCEIGTGACLREKITIGRRSLIGMGSVVIKSIEESSTIVGNPAKKLVK